MGEYSSGNKLIQLQSLHVHEYLGEFKTEAEKAMARRNLGILGKGEYDYLSLQDLINTNKTTIDNNYSKLLALIGINTLDNSTTIKDIATINSDLSDIEKVLDEVIAE